MDSRKETTRSWPSLTSLAEGTLARLRGSTVPDADKDLLTALGLVRNRKLLIRKIGAPCIVEVRGVRIGLAAPIAACLKVEPLDPPAPKPTPAA